MQGLGKGGVGAPQLAAATVITKELLLLPAICGSTRPKEVIAAMRTIIVCCRERNIGVGVRLSV